MNSVDKSDAPEKIAVLAINLKLGSVLLSITAICEDV
jgi:hypothetical protein